MSRIEGVVGFFAVIEEGGKVIRVVYVLVVAEKEEYLFKLFQNELRLSIWVVDSLGIELCSNIF